MNPLKDRHAHRFDETGCNGICEIAPAIIAAGIGAAGSIIGGSMGGGGQTVSQDPWKPAQPMIKEGLQDMQTAYGAGPPGYYPGQTWVDPNQMQLAGRANALGYAQGMGSNIIGMGQNAWANQANPFGNPLYYQMMGQGQRDIGRMYGEQIFPRIGDEGTQAGQFGSSRHGIAEGLAAARMGEQGRDLAGRMGFDAYNTGIQQQQWAAQQAPQMFNMGLLPSMMQQEIGGLYQGDVQQRLNDSMARYDYERDLPYTWANRYATDAANIGKTGQSSQTTTQVNPFAAGLGGAMTGYDLWNKIGGTQTAAAATPSYQYSPGITSGGFGYGTSGGGLYSPF